LPKHQENQENLVEVTGYGTFQWRADLQLAVRPKKECRSPLMFP